MQHGTNSPVPRWIWSLRLGGFIWPGNHCTCNWPFPYMLLNHQNMYYVPHIYGFKDFEIKGCDLIIQICPWLAHQCMDLASIVESFGHDLQWEHQDGLLCAFISLNYLKMNPRLRCKWKLDSDVPVRKWNEWRIISSPCFPPKHRGLLPCISSAKDNWTFDKYGGNLCEDACLSFLLSFLIFLQGQILMK